jgi:copper(I)-binding protein
MIRATLATLALLTPLAAADMAVENARIKELLPGQNQTTSYLNIANHGEKGVVLVGAINQIAGSIEIHRSVLDGPAVRMLRLSEFAVLGGETVRFHSGGVHLMLFRISRVPELMKISLVTRDGEQIPVIFRQLPMRVD